jgi:hypothetical protein
MGTEEAFHSEKRRGAEVHRYERGRESSVYWLPRRKEPETNKTAGS